MIKRKKARFKLQIETLIFYLKNTIEKSLFKIVPFVLLLLFCSSGEQILPIFENTFIEKYLNYISFSNNIVFNLCVGYLTGIFIYYWTAFVPLNRFKKQQVIINIRLLSLLNSRINSIFATILNCSTESEKDMRNVDSDMFDKICHNCDLDLPSGKKKIINENPYIIGDVLVRESLVEDWYFIISDLNSIENASLYIEPDTYILCLKIRRCFLSQTIEHLIQQRKDTNLEVWSSHFYQLYQLKKELDIKLELINKYQ